MRLEYELSAEDMMAAERLRWRTGTRWPMHLTGFGAVAVLLALVGLALTGSPGWLCAAVLPLSWLLMSWRVWFGLPGRWSIDVAWRQNPADKGPTVLETDETTAQVRSPNRLFKLNWAAVTALYETRRVVLVEAGPIASIVIPRRAFPTPESLAEFRRLAAPRRPASGQELAQTSSSGA